MYNSKANFMKTMLDFNKRSLSGFTCTFSIDYTGVRNRYTQLYHMTEETSLHVFNMATTKEDAT